MALDVSGGSDACWLWTGSRRGGGYGQFKVASYINTKANRVAYAVHYGVDPGSLNVLHSCDNPPCCNPRHLWLGTLAENSADMAAKGRWGGSEQQGDKNGNAKLKSSQVVEIKRLIASGKNNHEIARMFGVIHQTISSIKRGKTWRHV